MLAGNSYVPIPPSRVLHDSVISAACLGCIVAAMSDDSRVVEDRLAHLKFGIEVDSRLNPMDAFVALCGGS